MATTLKDVEAEQPLILRGHICNPNCGIQADGEQATQTVFSSVATDSGLGQSFQWMRSHDPAECDLPCPVVQDQTEERATCVEAQCDHSTLAETTNVFVLVRAKELQTIGMMNTVLAIMSVLFGAVNIVCCILNSYDNDCVPSPDDPHCSPATTPEIFHNLEFWATFVFNVTVLAALSYSPKVLSNKYENPTTLKVVVLSCIGLSFVSCMLVSINLEKFEIPSHELEYANELFMAVFDIIILFSLSSSRHAGKRSDSEDNYKTWFTLFISMLVACIQLGVYNLSGWTVEGGHTLSHGEKAAHYLEFTFNIISASILYWFTMDNRHCAIKRLQQLMYNDSGPIDNV